MQRRSPSIDCGNPTVECGIGRTILQLGDDALSTRGAARTPLPGTVRAAFARAEIVEGNGLDSAVTAHYAIPLESRVRHPGRLVRRPRIGLARLRLSLARPGLGRRNRLPQRVDPGAPRSCPKAQHIARIDATPAAQGESLCSGLCPPATAARSAPGCDRGRDGCCQPPPAQIRTCPIKAYGSYRRCVTRKRCSGHGCITRGFGSHLATTAFIRCHVIRRPRWLRLCRLRYQRTFR